MPTSLADKLQIRQGQTLAVLNPPAGMLERLARELPGNRVSGEMGDPDAVLLYVTSLAEAKELGSIAFKTVKPDALLWIAYAKGGSKVPTDVNRDKLWEALSGTGWRPVRQVALDEVWSAMRFRPSDMVERTGGKL